MEWPQTDLSWYIQHKLPVCVCGCVCLCVYVSVCVFNNCLRLSTSGVFRWKNESLTWQSNHNILRLCGCFPGLFFVETLGTHTPTQTQSEIDTHTHTVRECEESTNIDARLPSEKLPELPAGYQLRCKVMPRGVQQSRSLLPAPGLPAVRDLSRSLLTSRLLLKPVATAIAAATAAAAKAATVVSQKSVGIFI